MFRPNRTTSLLTALTMIFAGLALGVVAAAPASADTYSPPAGARINNPHGDWQSRNRVRWHIIRSIYSAPPRSRIRIMSWNIRDKAVTSALARVHRTKGISVQVLMQDDNAYAHEIDPNNPIPAPGDANPDWWWLKRQLSRYGNADRPWHMKSWAKLCDASCRGGSGIAHVKMALFEKVHRTPYVTMYTSGNLTKAAANIQWNDAQTMVNNREIYRSALFRFYEMARDQRMANPYRVVRNRGVQLGFFPWYGAGTPGDPILNALRPVRCTGAAQGYGTSRGRTIIRVSQTAIGDYRGRRIADRLVSLRRAGCNVKVLYGLMGPRVKGILRNGRVPIHQLATDDDGDWIYDRYLHQKVLTINGHYASDRTTTLTYNGTANMQGYTLRSDEILGRISAPSVTRFYQRWVDAWFGRTARHARSADGLSTGTDYVPEERARRAGIDPYAKFQVN